MSKVKGFDVVCGFFIVMLNVIMLNAAMLSVVAPFYGLQ
jgi:hypothetical protein